MRAAVLAATVLFSIAGLRWSRRSTSSSRAMQDRFSIVFPAQPKITETTYTSGIQVDAARHASTASTRDRATSRSPSSTTTTSGRLRPEKAKACPPGAEACSGTATDASSTGAGYWKPDIEGAVIHATWELMQRPNEKPVYLGWANMNLVEGHMLNLVNEKDKSRTSAAIYMHENKLYVIEGTVPAGYPVPDFFQQSVGWLDENGNDIRHLTIYHNGFPTPEVRRQGGGGQAPPVATQAAEAAEDEGINDDTPEDLLSSGGHVTVAIALATTVAGQQQPPAASGRRRTRTWRTAAATSGAGGTSAGQARNLGRHRELRQPADAADALHPDEPLQARPARRLPHDRD